MDFENVANKIFSGAWLDPILTPCKPFCLDKLRIKERNLPVFFVAVKAFINLTAAYATGTVLQTLGVNVLVIALGMGIVTVIMANKQRPAGIGEKAAGSLAAGAHKVADVVDETLNKAREIVNQTA